MTASSVSRNPGGNNGQERYDAVSGQEDWKHQADYRVGKQEGQFVQFSATCGGKRQWCLGSEEPSFTAILQPTSFPMVQIEPTFFDPLFERQEPKRSFNIAKMEQPSRGRGYTRTELAVESPGQQGSLDNYVLEPTKDRVDGHRKREAARRIAARGEGE